MKCQFCDQKCRLLKEDEPDFKRSEMTWFCDKHPTRVLHHVYIERYSYRRDSRARGSYRNWSHTTIRWNSKNKTIVAIYHRSDNIPCDFTLNYLEDDDGFGYDRYKEIFTMKEYPQDFSPENIAKKVGSYIVFL